MEEDIIFKKNKLQEKLIHKSDENQMLILNFATGIGKSLSSIKIMNKTSRENYKWIIVIDKLVHEQNWIDEFHKHNMNHLLDFVTFTTYKSIHKHVSEDIQYNIILDECHHITDASYHKLLAIKKINKIIGLSATLEQNKENLLIMLARLKSLSYLKLSYSISKAIQNGLVPKPKIKVLTINLSKEDTEIYEKMELDTLKKKNKFMSTMLEYAKVAWLRSSLDIKLWMGNKKYEYAKIISNSEYFKSKRNIIFTVNIDQAESVKSGAVIHSKNKNNKKDILKFNKKEINSITCVNMLKESSNLKDIEIGLVIQLDNQKLSTTQILGRILRANDPEILVLMLNVERDLKYVNNNLKAIAGDYMDFVEINSFLNHENNYRS